jgi:hypothetical protein
VACGDVGVTTFCANAVKLIKQAANMMISVFITGVAGLFVRNTMAS